MRDMIVVGVPVLSTMLWELAGSLAEKESQTERWREKRAGLYLILGLSLTDTAWGAGNHRKIILPLNTNHQSELSSIQTKKYLAHVNWKIKTKT